ncbi:DUF4301 family protein [Mangrovimonas spongiae]|uniref:DUF4301 family protein n=1 Tax=Mangrovimonas spongiae TaxID=2494697 RepID=A0A3R9UWU0_9FLAO|nr:DUF4301 family protein [Mangrovimonas spongiae]RSK41810.1 DUF4301 family protein [Mangrovimonas spongiae]
MNFSKQDVQQIKNKGLTVDKVKNQLQIFKTGLPPTKLKSAATIGHGIVKVSEEEKQQHTNFFSEHKDAFNIQKFVPASGAATRMFKFLFQFLEEFNPEEDDFEAYIQTNPKVKTFAEGLQNFPFYDTVVSKIDNYDALDLKSKTYHFANVLLNDTMLNFGAFPKGLLPFHKYKNEIRTPLEEHLLESSKYASSKGKANLHFTISPKHESKFKTELETVSAAVHKKTGITFNVTFSFQKEATDTIAVNIDNTPFRLEDGSMLFRPGGHGALIENLNDLNADLVFVKNIDNVVVDAYEDDVADYKKMLAGMLLKFQKEAFAYAKAIDENNLKDIAEVEAFLTNKLNVVFTEAYKTLSTSKKLEALKKHINKPIRVCGMVKNEGEPGGGPFWTESSKGKIALQIVESAQMNTNDETQYEISQNATHFNPVDLVCGLKNYKGEPYDLTNFVDEDAAFITQKTREGKPLKALERPGLWNGAMANWNTVFVEVPLITFNPVKTVNNLLKPTHQPHV